MFVRVVQSFCFCILLLVLFWWKQLPDMQSSWWTRNEIRSDKRWDEPTSVKRWNMQNHLSSLTKKCWKLLKLNSNKILCLVYFLLTYSYLSAIFRPFFLLFYSFLFSLIKAMSVNSFSRLHVEHKPFQNDNFFQNKLQNFYWICLYLVIQLVWSVICLVIYSVA